MKSLLKEKKQYSSKVIISAALLGSCLIGLIYLVWFSKPIPEKFLTIVKSELLTESLNIKGSGIITTESIDFVSAPYSGVVELIDVKEGQLVQQNQPMISIKNHELELELLETKFARDELAAESKLKMSELKQNKLNKESEITKLEAIRELKLTEIKAIKELEQQGIISKLDSRKAMLELSLAKLELESKERSFKLFSESYNTQIATFHERTEARDNKIHFLTQLVDSLEIKSDISGLVKQVGVKKGQTVSHGQKLFELINPNHMIAQISVPQYSASALQKGQSATVITPNGSLKGKVGYIDNVVRAGAINVAIRFESEMPDWLKLEQSVEAIIETNKMLDKAVVRKPDEFGDYKEWNAYLVNKDNLATKVDYTLLDRGDGYLDIIGQRAQRNSLLLVPKQFSGSLEVEL